jgi:hypothetical protein
MSTSSNSQKTASFVGILGAFLVVGLLLYVLKQSAPAPALNAARVQERKAALAELRDTSAKAQSTYDWQDQGKGIVRLTVDRAMELTIQEYRNPAAARSGLVARAEKANAAPPKAPEKPGQYE